MYKKVCNYLSLLAILTSASIQSPAFCAQNSLLIAQASQEYNYDALRYNDERAQEMQGLNAVQQQEKTVESQLAYLRNKDDSVARNEMYVLKRLINKDKQYERQYLANLNVINQWIAYYQSLSRSQATENEQSAEDTAAYKAKQLQFAQQRERDQQRTRIVEQQQRRAVYESPINTSPYDGWSSIQLPDGFHF